MLQNTPSSRKIKKWKEEVERLETERGIENMNNKFRVFDKISSFDKAANLNYRERCALCDASVNKLNIGFGYQE